MLSNKMLVFRAEIHKMLVSRANCEEPDQNTSLKKQSDLGLGCLSMPICQATSVRNFITFTVECQGTKIFQYCTCPAGQVT